MEKASTPKAPVYIMAQGLIFVPHSHFCPYSFLATKTPPPKIPNKAIRFLTYKLVLFIPGDKQTK